VSAGHGRVLALDYGSSRTGVAISDASGTLARPLTTVRRAAAREGLAELSAIIERERPELIVVGLPLTLAGQKGAQAAETASFVGRLRQRCEIPIVMEDERFTTRIARELSPRPADGDDAAAAAVLLQGFLDRHVDREDP
jgi:putative Holliday junction resolvase